MDLSYILNSPDVERVASALETMATNTTAAMTNKVDKNQGSGNAGKALIVGSDGIVVPGDASVPDAVTTALLACFRHVAWVDTYGQELYDALYEALTGTEPTPILPTGYTLKNYVTMSHAATTSGSAMYQTNTGARMLTQSYTNLNALDYEADLEVNLSNIESGGIPILGGRSQSGITHFVIMRINNSGSEHKLNIITHGTELSNGTPVFPNNTRTTIKYVNDSANQVTKVSVGSGTPVSVSWTNTNTINCPMGILTAYNSADTLGYLAVGTKIYGITLKDSSGTIVSKFVPCVRDSDNAIGFYDVVMEQFVTTATAKYATIGNTDCIYAAG